MKISCPFLHYPRYSLKVYMKDGGVMNMRGPGAAEIEVPVEPDAVLTMVCASCDEAGTIGHSRLWCGGEWVCYKDEDLEALLNQPEPPEREPEPEPEPEPEDEPSKRTHYIDAVTGRDVQPKDEETEMRRAVSALADLRRSGEIEDNKEDKE